MYRQIKAFLGGGAIGILGGLIGLGGAEFRLPMLISLFGFSALSAIILNKAMSLIVVLFAFLFRSHEIPFLELWGYSDIIVSMLVGSMVGAWYGAGIALRLKSEWIYKVIALLLAGIAIVLFLEQFGFYKDTPLFEEHLCNMCTGVFLGIGIGIVAAILGVAGGELYIPAIILIYGIDIKIAGSLSLAISLPTMLVAFYRYSKDQSFRILFENKSFIIIMGIGSIVGTLIGALLIGIVSNNVLIPLLCAILITSSYKMYKHKENKE